ncbi:MAG: glycoside hydrolase family 3 C-terminal domain-containing protein [Bryobacteraceae bacterium]
MPCVLGSFGKPLTRVHLRGDVLAQVGPHVAKILFSDTDPSGKLAITVPRHSGQLPAYYNYNYKPSKEYWITKSWGKRYVDMLAMPLYPFAMG